MSIVAFASRIAESREEGRWIDADRAVRCVEPDCRTVFDGLVCPRCTSSNPFPLAPLLDRAAVPYEDAALDHARALASVGMPGGIA